MAATVTYHRLILMSAGLAGLVFATPAQAGNGYEGLIAPTEPQKAAPAPPSSAPSSGYEGVLAPSQTNNAAGRPAEEPPGYTGVIPGRVSTPQQSTGALNPLKPVMPQTGNDLIMLSATYGGDKDGDGVPDGLSPPARVSDRIAEALSTPRPRTKGMLPMEFAAVTNVERLLPQAMDTSLPESQRLENAKKAFATLSNLAEGIRQKRTVPDDVYRQKGLSEIFIKEEREGDEAALVHLDKALRELKDYQ